MEITCKRLSLRCSTMLQRYNRDNMNFGDIITLLVKSKLQCPMYFSLTMIIYKKKE